MVWEVCYGPYKLAEQRRRADINRRSAEEIAEDVLGARRKLAARSKATVVFFGVAKSIGYLVALAILMGIGFMFTYHGGLIGKVVGTTVILVCGILALAVLFGELVDDDINDWHRARRELRPKWINDIESVYAGTGSSAGACRDLTLPPRQMHP